MLPIRWIFSGGGALLAIAVLALAFTAPDRPRTRMPNAETVRSTFIELGERPEWRQFVILSAIQRRADELSRLRELPDTPVRTDDISTAPEIAALVAHGNDPEEDDETEVNMQAPAAIVPADTGESLAIEFPVAAANETPSATKTLQQVKSHNHNRVKGVQHVRRRVRVLASGQPFPFGTGIGQGSAVNTNNYFGDQAWQTKSSNGSTY
jgi:hypothetical protein